MAGFHNQTDMIEEDAADLQFPKDDDILELVPNETTQRTVQYYKQNNYLSRDKNIDLKQCGFCRINLTEPYISCGECSHLICLTCFCRGSENLIHKNTHSYRVLRDDNFEVFPHSNWNAKTEKEFLELLLVNGYGNWSSISKSLRTKTANECREHYLKYYFGGVFEKTLGLTNEPYRSEFHPYMYKMISIDPPRYDIDHVNFKRMAGYRSARGEFDIPFDPSAESVISHLCLANNDEINIRSNETYDLLNCAVFRTYNNRLMERKRRYKIIREHGLIMASKTLSWLSKHSDALSWSSEDYSSTGRFVAFMQLMPAITFDAIVESLQYATDLKNYLYKLCDLRKNGITTFYGGQVYYKLKAKRFTKLRNKKIIQFQHMTDWRNLTSNVGQNIQYFSNAPVVIGMPRRKAAPLEILGLPGYDKLTEDERNLCSTIRLSPLAYMEYKNILTAENSKHGFLRLAEARRLIKIDVNKTRQMYDFLLKFGLINKPLI